MLMLRRSLPLTILLASFAIAGPQAKPLARPFTAQEVQDLIDKSKIELNAGAIHTDFRVRMGGDIHFSTSSSDFTADVLDRDTNVPLKSSIRAGPLPTEKPGTFLLVVVDRQAKQQTVDVAGDRFCQPPSRPPYKNVTVRVQYEVQ